MVRTPGLLTLPAALAIALSAAPFAAPQAPAPERQAPPNAADANDIKVQPIRGNVYMLVVGDSNITVQVEPPTRPPRIPGTYIGGYGVLLVDTAGAAHADQVRAAIRRASQGPIRYILNTHIHPDHMGGNEALASAGGRGGRGGAPAVTILSHENMLLQLAQAKPPTPPAALPTDAYLDVKELFFNGEPIQVFHQPGAHTDGDSIVYFRKSDVLSVGDLFSTTTYPAIDTARGGTLKGVIEGLNRILDLAVPESNGEGGTMVVPGHGRLSDESDVVEFRNMNVIIRDRILDMARKGMTLEQVKAAKPTLDYDYRYGRTSGPWTTDMFISAIYDEVSREVAPAPTRRRPS
jgi:glyoxylase-like metal-dependent hydrolase (beta-lactamase superfamily II)